MGDCLGECSFLGGLVEIVTRVRRIGYLQSYHKAWISYNPFFLLMDLHFLSFGGVGCDVI
jgi:hypothetical protein